MLTHGTCTAKLLSPDGTQIYENNNYRANHMDIIIMIKELIVCCSLELTGNASNFPLFHVWSSVTTYLQSKTTQS